MKKKERVGTGDLAPPLELSDDDVYEAMKEVQGYLDITPADFKQLYILAYNHALFRIMGSVKAADIMTRDVVRVTEQTPLMDVADIMAARGISGVPVVNEEGKVTGIISEKDFIVEMEGQGARSFMGVVAKCLRNKTCVALSMRHQKAFDIMSTPPVTIRESAPLDEVADILACRGINRVPVIDETGRPVGIVTRDDVFRAFYRLPASLGSNARQGR